jgi:hypothetical protein
MMNTKTPTTEKFRITGDWTKWSKLLKEKYSQLTDKDLILENGREEELLFRLQRRLFRNRDGVIEILTGIETARVGAYRTTIL